MVADPVGQGGDDLLVAAADLVPLVALAVDLEPARRVGADRLDEVQARLVREVQAELVDVGGLEDVVEPSDLLVPPEVVPQRSSDRAGLEAGVAVEGDLVAELRRVVVDDLGQGLEGVDDLVFGAEPAVGEVGDLQPASPGACVSISSRPKS